MQVASNPALANPAPASPPPPPAAPSDPQAAADHGPNGAPSASDPAATAPEAQPGSYFAGFTKPLIQGPGGRTFAPGHGAPLLGMAAQAATTLGGQPESLTAMTQPLYLGRASSGLLSDLMSGGQPLPTGGDAPWGRPEFMPRPQPALADMGMVSRPGVTTNNKGPLRMDNPDAYFAGTAPGRLPRVPDLVQRQPDGRGSQGEQDAFSGQPGNQDGQHPLFQQPEDNPIAPVDLGGPYPPGKDGHPLRMEEPSRPTEVQIPESAPSKTPEAKPVDPAAPVDPATSVGEAAPAGPTADPMEIQALELMLADPANKEIIENFGGELEPLPTWSTVGQGIEARYGADLGGRLYQLQNAQRAVEGEFFKAKDLAKDAPPSIPVPYVQVGSKDVPVSDRPGWIYSAGSGHADGDPPSWQFDEAAFARDYAAGDTPAQRALAYMHGNKPLTFVPHVGTDGTAESHWALDGLITRPDVERLAPNRITKLINNEAIWFDPVQGFSTDIENLKPNALDRAFPYVFAAAATVITFGVAGAVSGPAAASAGAAGGSTASTGMLGGAVSGAFGGGTAGSIAVGAASGAFNSAVLQFVVNGKVDFGQVVKSAVSGGVTAGMSKLPGVGQYIDGAANTFGQRLMEYTGRATVQGALQTVLGGKFQDGFAGSLLSGLAGEVTGHIDAQIKDMKGLTGAETGTLHLLNRAVGTAMRLVGSDDPAAGFAGDFLGGLIQEGATSQDLAGVGVNNPSNPSSGNPALASQQTASNTTVPDPLGDFIAANEQSWADREADATGRGGSAPITDGIEATHVVDGSSSGQITGSVSEVGSEGNRGGVLGGGGAYDANGQWHPLHLYPGAENFESEEPVGELAPTLVAEPAMTPEEIAAFDREHPEIAGLPSRPQYMQIPTGGDYPNVLRDTYGELGLSFIDRQMEGFGRGWSRDYWSVLEGERPSAYDFARRARDIFGEMTVADRFNQARIDFANGNNFSGFANLVGSFGEAGLTAFPVANAFGAAGMRRAAGIAAERGVDPLSGNRPANWDALTSHPNAHALQVHGGTVTEGDLIVRATTGRKPNGELSGIPRLSTAFYSDRTLIEVDAFIRDSGALERAIARQPGLPVIEVAVQDVGELGRSVGYGYHRIGATGNAAFNGSVFGPLMRVDGLSSARGVYQFNPEINQWQTITLYPERYKSF